MCILLEKKLNLYVSLFQDGLCVSGIAGQLK